MTDKFPVPCVRLIIEDVDERILLLRRNNSEYGNGQWCLPGGKVDYGQRIEDTCKKELEEEAGLNTIDLEYLFVQDSLPLKEGGMHCLNHYFLVEAQGEIRLNSESSEARWVPPTELHNYDIVFRNDEGIERFLKEK